MFALSFSVSKTLWVFLAFAILNRENKQLNSIIFKLTNERGEYITDTSDYMMVVQFNFYEQEDVNGTLKSLVTILNQN